MKHIKLLLYIYLVFGILIFVVGLGNVPKDIHWYECPACFYEFFNTLKWVFLLPIVNAAYSYYKETKAT